MQLLSRDGQQAEFIVKRTLDVGEPSKISTGGPSETAPSPPNGFPTSAFPEIVDLVQLQADLLGQREDINRIDSNGFKIVSALDTRVARIGEQVGRLRDTLGNIRRDIGGVQDDLSSLKVDVNGVKRTAQDDVPLSVLE